MKKLLTSIFIFLIMIPLYGNARERTENPKIFDARLSNAILELLKSRGYTVLPEIVVTAYHNHQDTIKPQIETKGGRSRRTNNSHKTDSLKNVYDRDTLILTEVDNYYSDDPFMYSNRISMFYHRGFNYWYYNDPYYYNPFFYDPWFYNDFYLGYNSWDPWYYPHFYFGHNYWNPWYYSYGYNYVYYPMYNRYAAARYYDNIGSPKHMSQQSFLGHQERTNYAQSNRMSPQMRTPYDQSKRGYMPTYQVNKMPVKPSFNNSHMNTRTQANQNMQQKRLQMMNNMQNNRSNMGNMNRNNGAAPIQRYQTPSNNRSNASINNGGNMMRNTNRTIGNSSSGGYMRSSTGSLRETGNSSGGYMRSSSGTSSSGGVRSSGGASGAMHSGRR
jgi:hypothetical protein